MLLHKTTWLTVGVFFIAITTAAGGAEPQASKKDLKAAKLNEKKWATIDGFRSAKFGMDEKQVMRAIAKDFKLPKSKVEVEFDVNQKTMAFIITIPNIIQVGGPSNVRYILGYKSKRLIEVSIVWPVTGAKVIDPRGVVSASKLLLRHFLKKKYKKDHYYINRRLKDETVNRESAVVFNGLDEKARMIRLVLTLSKNEEKKDPKEAAKDLSLKLSYMLDNFAPDIFKTKAK